MEKNKRFAIIGASGKLGHSAAKFLLAHDCEVRVIGRNSHRLRDLIDDGVTPYIGELKDAAFLEAAFNSVDGVLVMIPGWEDQKNVRFYLNEIGISIFTACMMCDVPQIVNISDYSVRFKMPVDYLLGLADQESRLNILTKSTVIHLRPTCFLPNLHQALNQVISAARNPSISVPLETTLPSAEDIGEIAASFLYEGKVTGKHIVEMTGDDALLIKRVAAENLVPDRNSLI